MKPAGFPQVSFVGGSHWSTTAGSDETCGLGGRFQVPATLAEHVGQGDYRTKTGAGFFSYTPEERERLFADRDRRYAALSELLEQLP